MAHLSQPEGREDFEVAILCALKSEAEAVEALFDRFWSAEMYGKVDGDSNTYTLGVIGLHNVVLVHAPSTGKAGDASVAVGFQLSFPRIGLALVVGICGAVPYGNDREILLGDVIISTQQVYYDARPQSLYFPDRKFVVKHRYGWPSAEIRSLFFKLQRYRSQIRLEDNTSHYLTQVQQKLGIDKARYPGVDADKLFEPTYRHKHHDSAACSLCTKCMKKEDLVCETALKSSCLELKCNENRLIPRRRPLKAKETIATPEPTIYYGWIASGSIRMKSSEYRGIIDSKHNIVALEMKSVRDCEHFPHVKIKGVCNYADGHINKYWEGYAAATAAACVKAFLKEWFPSNKALGIISASEGQVSSNENLNTSRQIPRGGNFVSDSAADVLHGLEHRETPVSNAFNSIPMQNLNDLSDSTNRADSDMLSSVNGHSTMLRFINDLYRCHLCLVLYVT